MKLLLSASIVLILLLGSGLAYTYNKLSNLYPTIAALKTQNKTLTKQKNKLQSDRKKMRSKYKERRARLTKQKLARANKKLISAAPKMVPFVAIPIVVAATSYDIKGYCDEINEMEHFEYELFGESTPSSVDNKICGVDVEAELQKSANSITSQYENALVEIQKEYQDEKEFWSETLNNAKEEIIRKGYDIQSGFSESLEGTAKYLSEENEKTSNFWNDLYDDFFDK